MIDVAIVPPYVNQKIADKAQNLVGSEIIKLGNEINEKIRLGEKIDNLTIGDFNPEIFPIPTLLKEKIIEAYQNNQTNYPTANGILDLRKAVSRYLITRLSLEYSEDQILIAGGARPLIYATYQTILNKDEKVIYPIPSWNNNHYTYLSDAQKIEISTKAENNFMPTAEDIKKHLGEAHLVSLCSPLNPTGTVFSSDELQKICYLILEENKRRGDLRKPVYLMYDHIYWGLTHNLTQHFDPVNLCPEMKNYTIYIDGISKVFAATGVRVGWAFGPEKIMNKMKAILGHIGAWAPKAEQVACAEFLNEDDEISDYLYNFKSAIYERLDTLHKGIQTLKEEGLPVDSIEPQAAMYLTVKISINGKKTEEGEILEDAEQAAIYLINEAKVGIVPFYAFGDSRKSEWYRVSVGTLKTEDIEGILARIKAALEKLS